MTIETVTSRESRPLPLFIELELLTGELYEIFAGKYPECREFREAISAEERHHADILREVGRKMESGGVLFVQGKTRTGALQSFIGYLRQIIAKGRKESFPFGKALSIALDIERSFIERNAPDHFRGDSADVAITLEKLRSDSGEHARPIETAWRRTKETVPPSPPAESSVHSIRSVWYSPLQ